MDCVQDGVLNQRDLVKVLQRIVAGTKKSATKQMKPSQAAARIQSVWQGRKQRSREKTAKVRTENTSGREKKQHKRLQRLLFSSQGITKAPPLRNKTKLEAYADKVRALTED